MKSLFVFAAVLFAVIDAREFTVINKCPYNIWPAIWTNDLIALSAPSFQTGWQATPGNSTTFFVPPFWAGYIWGRTDCDFSTNNTNANSCVTGGCIGGLECIQEGGTPVAPATTATFAIDQGQGTDYYAISIIDGFNLIMDIENTGGCPKPDCNTDINQICPDYRMKVNNTQNDVVGCLSACKAAINPNVTDSSDCCTGSFNSSATCPASGVTDYQIFNQSCPDAFSWPFAPATQAQDWVCSNSTRPGYTITFCSSESAPHPNATSSQVPLAMNTGLGNTDLDDSSSASPRYLVTASVWLLTLVVGRALMVVLGR